MMGLVPIFISCKNGMLMKENCNKAAEKFVGSYAKKLIFATYCEKAVFKVMNILCKEQKK